MNWRLTGLLAAMVIAVSVAAFGFGGFGGGIKNYYVTNNVDSTGEINIPQKDTTSHYVKMYQPYNNGTSAVTLKADENLTSHVEWKFGDSAIYLNGAEWGGGGSGTFSNSTTAVYGATKTLPAAAANKMFSFRNQTTSVTLVPSSGTQSIYLADGTTPGAGYGIDCVGDGQVLLTAYDALSWWVLTEAGMTCTGGDLALVASLTWSPASKDYGNVTVGQNATQSFTLTNSGTGQASGLSVSVSGATFATYSSTCGSTLAASANCTVGVRYTPDAADADSGTLTAAAAGLSDTTASLSGTGVSSCALYTDAANTGSSLSLASNSTNVFLGQVVNSGQPTVNMCQVDFYFKTITGDLTGIEYVAQIYSRSGTALGTLKGTSSTVLGQTISAGTYVQFTFSSPVSVESGDAIVVTRASGTSTTNYAIIGYGNDDDGGYSYYSKWQADKVLNAEIISSDIAYKGYSQ